jgi:hypothetical protein
MRAVGKGRDLWRVEIVMRAPEPDADRVRELLNAVEAATEPRGDSGELRLPDVESTWSYDAQPPEGGVGVACWVQSDSVGDAAEQAWHVVREATADVLGAAAPLWDLRVIPQAAILTATEAGTPFG